MKRISLLFLFFLVCSAIIYADIDTAEKLLKQGEREKAAEEFGKWLENNKNADNFFDVLIRASEISEDVDTGILLMNKYIPAISNPENTRKALEVLGEYYEMTGDISNAQKAYEKGADISGIRVDYNLLLRSALLLQYMGEYKRSELQIFRVLQKSSETDISTTCYLLLARIYLITGEKDSFRETVKELSNSDSPEILYFLKKKLNDRYSLSPEYLLQKGKIDLLPDIETALGLLDVSSPVSSVVSDRTDTSETAAETAAEKKDKDVFYIQTGSFRDRDNAEYMSRDLEELGFRTTISDQTIKGKLYHKVYITASSVDEVPDMILKLKDAGYEGYPVY